MPTLNIAASSTLIPTELTVTGDTAWQDIAYICTTPGSIYPDLNHLIGYLSFQSIGGGQVRLLQNDVIKATGTFTETEGWVFSSLVVPGPMSDVTVLFTIQARRNGAALFKIRGMSGSLLVV